MGIVTNPAPANGSSSDPQPQRSSAAAGPASFSEDGPINILIVDDESKNLTVLETILDDPGYRLVRASSADQALLALVVEEFALLILDIRMPGMTGFELAQMIKDRKKTARVPIIFLTAYYNEDQHVLEGYGTGAVDYLHKPVNPAILRSKVAVFAELYRKGRESVQANIALLAEVVERRRVEEQLRELNETLEQRVLQRTEALRASETAERARRAEMEALMDAIPAAVFIAHDAACQQFTGNRAAMSMLRLPYGCDLSRIVLETDSPAYEVWSAGRLLPLKEHPMQRAAAAGQAVFGAELELVFPDGGKRHILGNALPLFDDTGAVRGCVGAFVDITERKGAEEALVEADRRKDEFLAMLAHELRNPLAPIRNAVLILQLRGQPDPTLNGACQMIDRQVNQLVRLVDDLLDVSRVSLGKIRLNKEPLDLATIIQLALDTSRPLIDARRHRLTVTLPHQTLWVQADLTRLAQVVSNLLNNAAKYTDEGGSIWLTVEKASPAKDRPPEAVIRVRDTGRGIDPPVLKSLFDMFYQVDRNLDRSDGGLGIGLSLVKRLAEMHGGRVDAQSLGRGKGSEFMVRLPLIPQMLPVAEDASAAATPSSRPVRILVVDDNRDSADSMAMLLKIDGHEVFTAHDGKRAVEIALRERPSAILLDIGLPYLDGYQACRAMRDGGLTDTLIIAMTGYGQEEDLRQSEEAGFDAHRVKPVEMSSIRTLLAQRGVGT